MQVKIDKALKILGIRNFLLGIHDPAFPSRPEEDLGRGSPYSEGAADFLRFAGSLGFNGVQLGPQGVTSPVNPSPYDGSFFSRNPLSLAPSALTRSDCRLLAPERLAGVIDQLPAQSSAAPTRVDDTFVRLAIGDIAAEICARYRREMKEDKSASYLFLCESFGEYRRKHAAWLERDALYETLAQYYENKSWQQWNGAKEAELDRHLFGFPADQEKRARDRRLLLHRQYAEAIEDYCFIQFLLDRQHRELRARCRKLGLKLFGDCQIGFSTRDAWAAQSFLLPGYVMGAPPSRTNPEGQPWNYPLLDPDHYFVANSTEDMQPGAALRFLKQRIEKLVEEFDGLRLDHPHGLICPWVYKSDQDDAFYAVQNGARLFASPVLRDHPALSKYAIVRPDQLNMAKKRYDDNWVADLDVDQVRRYGQLFHVIMAAARKKWAGTGTIACEILSTQPYPIKRVLGLYGLGRFRVTQKADPQNEQDVYRSENAQPEDWLMLGNHDTDSIWQVVDNWLAEGTAPLQAGYLATRLAVPEAERTGWIQRLLADPGALVQAKFADLFVGPAQNIMVFFTDLLGYRETYNKPGIVSAENWTLRIPADFEKTYRDKVVDNRALNIPGALALALRARGESACLEHGELIRQLEEFC